jgi:hypothetical protein
MSIEALPLDLNEDQAEFALDFYYRAEAAHVGWTAIAIAIDVARNTILAGTSCVPHREYQRRTGKCRRSVDKAIKRLKAAGLIERIDTSPEGIAVYRANMT